MKMITPIVLFVLFCAGLCSADVGDIYRFQMKTGEVVQGKVLSANRQVISVQSGGLTTEIQVANIANTKLVEKIQAEKVEQDQLEKKNRLVQQYVANLKKDGGYADGEHPDNGTTNSATTANSDMQSARYVFDEADLDCDGQWRKCRNHVDDYYRNAHENGQMEAAAIPERDCRAEYQRCLKETGYVYDKKGELDFCSRKRDECSASNGTHADVVSEFEDKLRTQEMEDVTYCQEQKNQCSDRYFASIKKEKELQQQQQQQERDDTSNNMAESSVTANQIDKQKFIAEHNDYVDVQGFQELRFGMTIDEVNQVLRKMGKKEQYYDNAISAYTSETFPVYDQEVYSQFRYDGPSKTLNQINLGVMDNFGLGDSLTGIVFMDVSDQKMQFHPLCQDGEKLVKQILKKYRHVDLHNKVNEVEPSSNAKVEIENHILNYGSVLMKVRKYDFPKLSQLEMQARVGWYVKDKTIISLEYCDLNRGVKNVEAIESAKQNKKAGGKMEF